MCRTVSIHIGVNKPGAGSALDTRTPLADSETAAWRMAELASQAGYGSMLVLRGQTATLAAVNAALWNVSQLLADGDELLVTFSGHGGKVADRDDEDPDGSDESWSLHDGELLDDTLCGYWQLFKAGVRIVVVSESCYSGGMLRTADEEELLVAAPPAERRMRGEPPWQEDAVTKAVGPGAVVEPPRDPGGVRATVLLLTATSEKRPARAGLFTTCLLEVWAGGNHSGSYRELFDDVRQRVLRANPDQEPQLLMLGAPDPGFPRAPAFRPQPGRARTRSDRMRG
jgi:metacaspase-1